MNNKPSILFLCTGNSCRSQMAEGLCRQLAGDRFEVYSAGIETHGLNPHAVKVMAEIGIDISGHTSKTTAELDRKDFDFVITVCGHAHESCPYFPAKTKIIHRGFDDPPWLTKDMQDGEEKLDVYRRVRDEIREYVLSLVQETG
ncbi:MAG: arsenate reductase ArsC [Spirochaetales bacterium]|nr:arsenate reductase ArsC [Spirochaetales bacterium]